MSRARLWTGGDIDIPRKPRPIYLKGERFCPKCGSPLVTRKGPHGDFAGCSAYPACTYTSKSKAPRDDSYYRR